MSEGFQIGSEEGIDLSFGPDTVTPSEFGPAPDGIYKLFLGEPPEVTKTKAGEQMLRFKFVIIGPGYEGKFINDSAVIPGEHRREEFTRDGQSKWNVMMNMLCEKLEALTGESWRKDNVKLVPSQLSGHTIIAKITTVDREFVPKKDNPEGKVKMGHFNEIDGNWRVDDGSIDQLIEAHENSPAPQQDTGSGFKL